MALTRIGIEMPESRDGKAGGLQQHAYSSNVVGPAGYAVSQLPSTRSHWLCGAFAVCCQGADASLQERLNDESVLRKRTHSVLSSLSLSLSLA